MLLFGEKVTGKILCIFGLYNVLTFTQKAVTLCKNSTFLSIFKGSFYPAAKVYFAYILLPFKEILFIFAEKRYIEKSVMEKHSALEEKIYNSAAKEKEILIALNEVSFEVDLAGEKALFIQKYTLYFSKILSVVFILALKLRPVLLLYTLIYILLDILIKKKTQKLFKRHKEVLRTHSSSMLLIFTEIEKIKRSAKESAKENMKESSDIEKDLERLKLEYRIEEKIYKNIRFWCFFKESLLSVLNKIFFQLYILGMLVHMLWYKQKNIAYYFMTMYKKLEKLSKCVLKIF